MKEEKEKNGKFSTKHARSNELRSSGRQAIDVTSPVRFDIDEIISDELIDERLVKESE